MFVSKNKKIRKLILRSTLILLLSLISSLISAKNNFDKKDATLARPVEGKQKVIFETVASGLSHPWAVAFLPDGNFLVTERSGSMRIIDTHGKISPPLLGLPTDLVSVGQGGLLDVILDRNFIQNRRLFFCFSQAEAGRKNSTALASAILQKNNNTLQNVKIIFTQKPKVSSNLHFGCRILQDIDNSLFLTLGDRASYKEEAQKLNNHLGKIIHILPDGKIPKNNPFLNDPQKLPEIWSLGHRNIQGATFAPDGKLWMHEHGPQGGDEINIINPAKNYGWPSITYGVNYGTGTKIGKGTFQDGMEQPIYYWNPSIAPSGMTFLTSERYGKNWQGSLFVGSLKFARLHRLTIQNNSVVLDEYFPYPQRQRIRDVRQSPDGWIYLLTDAADGRLLRLKLSS